MAKKRNHPKPGNVDRVHKPLTSYQKEYHASIHSMTKNTFSPSLSVSQMVYIGAKQFVGDLNPQHAKDPLRFVVEVEIWIKKTGNGQYSANCIPFLATAWGLASVYRGDPDPDPEGRFVVTVPAPAAQRSERAA